MKLLFHTSIFALNACGTCPVCLHKVNFELFTPWGVKFLCCHDYALAACDVRVILEHSEIERHIRRLQETKFKRPRRRFGKRETELVSSLFSNFEGIDVSRLYTKESRTSNSANVVWRHMLASVLHSIYGLSRERHVMRLEKRLSCHCFYKSPLSKSLRQFLGQIKIEMVSQVSFLTFPWGIMLCTFPI